MEDFLDKVFSRHTVGLVARQFTSIDHNDRQMHIVQEKIDLLVAALQDSKYNYRGLPESTIKETEALIADAKDFAHKHQHQNKTLQFLLSDSAKELFKELISKLDYQLDGRVLLLTCTSSYEGNAGHCFLASWNSAANTETWKFL